MDGCYLFREQITTLLGAASEVSVSLLHLEDLTYPITLSLRFPSSTAQMEFPLTVLPLLLLFLNGHPI